MCQTTGYKNTLTAKEKKKPPFKKKSYSGYNTKPHMITLDLVIYH